LTSFLVITSNKIKQFVTFLVRIQFSLDFFAAVCFSQTFLLTSVFGIPSWNNGRGLGLASANDLMATADALTAITSLGLHPQPRYLTATGDPGLGVDSHAFIVPHISPSLYLISPPNGGQLYQLLNESSIMHVNIMNVTEDSTARLPFKLRFGQQKEGVMDGWWSWIGTRLHYNHGDTHNSGLFYDCKEVTGQNVLYMSLNIIQTPPDCYIITLHSLARGVGM